VTSWGGGANLVCTSEIPSPSVLPSCIMYLYQDAEPPIGIRCRTRFSKHDNKVQSLGAAENHLASLLDPVSLDALL
jgi:hypothetical protein